jgi:hypothetical protein
MLLLARDRPASKHSEVQWWEKFLLTARLPADRLEARTSVTRRFARPRLGRGATATTDDPLLRALAAEASRIGELHYATAGNVVLSNEARDKLKRITDEYFEMTGRDLYVTSGSRTPKKQAAAMYDNFINRRNQSPPYKNQQAFKEIKAVYELGLHQHWGRSKTVDMMTAVIENQVAHGTYLSRHLHGQGIDVRKRDMSSHDSQAFERAVDDVLHLDARGEHRWFREEDRYHVQF